MACRLSSVPDGHCGLIVYVICESGASSIDGVTAVGCLIGSGTSSIAGVTAEGFFVGSGTSSIAFVTAAGCLAAGRAGPVGAWRLR